jgi:hypothetical protein
MRANSIHSTKAIASLVSMFRLLEVLGFAVDSRKRRCPCLLHGGMNPNSFSWREDGRWFCFACGKGGGRIALVMAVRKCGMRDAASFLAAIAGVRFSMRRRSRTELRRLAEKRQRARRLAWQLRDEIVSLRGVFRDRLLRVERLQWTTGEYLRVATAPEQQEQYWGVLARLAPVVTFFLASFNFLNDADMATLITFVRAPHPARRNMILGGLV